MTKALYAILQEHNNDYSTLEKIYREKTGGELVCDPFNSPRYTGPEITLSASVIIPAWNAKNTIEKCLIAIEQSSFNKRYPHLLEVVVVDDGSTDETWHVLENLDLNLRLKAIFQKNHSQPHAVNTGISIAEGDVIICCDDDMILAPFAIEELMKRHQLFENILLIGFRFNVSPEDTRIKSSKLHNHLPHFIPKFYMDERLHFHWPGWPENMCAEYDHLKKLGGGKQIWISDGNVPDGDMWNLERMVYGALFSMRRSQFHIMDGFDEDLHGWGWDDTIVGARAIALGNYIVPAYSAVGMHIAHPDRSANKWEESDANYQVLQNILNALFDCRSDRRLNQARKRIIHQIEYHPKAAGIYSGIPISWISTLSSELNNPLQRGLYMCSLGRYNEAVSAFENVSGDETDEAIALLNKGKVLRLDRKYAKALETLKLVLNYSPLRQKALIEIGFASAGGGYFNEARTILNKAYSDTPQDGLLHYTFDCPLEYHLRRGKKYASQSDYAIAARDFEAVLIRDPGNAEVKRNWNHCQLFLKSSVGV